MKLYLVVNVYYEDVTVLGIWDTLEGAKSTSSDGEWRDVSDDYENTYHLWRDGRPTSTYIRIIPLNTVVDVYL